MKTKLLFAGLLVMIVCSMPAAYAQDFIARQMRFTINGPVEFPGRILEPGTYFIRRDLTPLRQGTDSVIQVLDEKRHVLLTTIGIYARRSQPLPEPFEFYEAAQGKPPAVRSWFLPGTFEGYDFVYPEGRANLANVVQPSTATVTYTAEFIPPAEPAPEPAPEPGLQPAPAEPELSLEKPSEPPPPPPVEPTPPATLPKTAGETQLLVLVGCVFLIGLAAVHLVRKANVN